MTVNDHVVRYQEHISTKSYEELVAAFEETVPDAGPGEPTRTLERVRDGENSREAWEAAVAPLFGTWSCDLPMQMRFRSLRYTMPWSIICLSSGHRSLR
jgi:hypothetical protein